jgi:hypothetical protein
MLKELKGLPQGRYVNDKHLLDLKASGLSESTIREAYVFSASSRETFRLLGYPAGPGLVFLYDEGYCRVKPDTKMEGKYRSPKGLPTQMYIPHTLDRAKLFDPAEPLIITGGEKKALRAVQDGFTCVAFGGFWNWVYQKKPAPDPK